MIRPHLVVAALVLGLPVTALAQAGGSASAAAPSPATEEMRQDAKRLFERGVKLLEKGQFDAALIDFKRSREVFPTRSATENAAICMRELGKTADAFEMFRTLLREFPDLPADVKARVENQISLLDAQLGRLVFVADEGTAVTVDGRPIGKLPLSEPTRVVAGRNVVRMYLDGYSVFETQVVSARGKETTVEPKFELLGTVGRMRVKEKSGVVADVLVDGVVVGKTPWEGALAPGEHAVWLSAEGGRGTAPTRARVILAQKTETVLELAPIVSTMRVSVTPPAATLSLDGVALGTGSLDLALPAGGYKLDATLDGFSAHTQTVEIATGKLAKFQITLRPLAATSDADPFELGLTGAATLSPELDGIDCDDCTRGLGVGGYVSVVGGYRLPFGLGFDVEVGYHRASATLDRTVSLTPVGLEPRSTSFEETWFMTGATLLGGASYRPPLGDLMLLVVSSRFGGYFGGGSVTRDVKASGDDPLSIGPYKSGSEMFGFVIKPEVRLGLSVTEWLDVWVSGAAMVVFPLSVDPWGYEELVPLGNSGAARFSREELWGPHVHLMPGVGVGLSL